MKKRNIQEQQAYEEGYDAYNEGEYSTTNPYNTEELSDAWCSGYDKAKSEYYEYAETE